MSSRFILFFLSIFLFLSINSRAGEEKGDLKTKSKGTPTYQKRDDKLRVFVEGIWLDMDYLRRRMRYVDFVMEPAVADVHIIINNRVSGSGGHVYSMMYNNLTFDNFSDFTISATTLSSDTYEEERKKIADALALGLMPFVNQTKASEQLVLNYKGNDNEIKHKVTDDPWNNWTFRGDVSGYMNLEESRKIYDYSFNIRADKVTEDWRIRNNARRSVNKQKYESEGETYSSVKNTTYASSSIVKSINSRWSTGAFINLSNSNYQNLIYSLTFKPAIEYNIFPWDISDRKVFTIAYYIGPKWNDYYEETIYDKLDESLWEQSMQLDLQLVQTWGEIQSGLHATNYLQDWSKNRITFNSNLSVRIIRGLSVRMGFRVENIHDQIYLAKGDVSLEDILLNKVQLPSSFEVGANLGLRIQFGSIYNNIVNNRL